MVLGLRLLFLLILAYGTSTVHAEQNIAFSENELSWIDSNSTIRVGGVNDVPPFSFVKDGQITGYSVEYLAKISEITGLKFVFDTEHKWPEQLLMAQNQKIDMFHMVRERESISEFMSFTEPYITGSSTLLYGKTGQTNVDSIQEISNKSVAVVRGYSEQVFLSSNYPEVKLNVVDSLGEGLRTVLTGESDYFVCESNSCDSYIYQNFMSGISVVGRLGIERFEKQHKGRLAVRQDLPELFSIINKAMALISETELNNLKAKWVEKPDREELLVDQLSDTGKQWLSQNRRLVFAQPLKLAPFAFVVNKEAKGMAADLVKRFESEYDVQAYYEHKNSWKDVVDAVTNGDVDFVPVMNITPERQKKLLFTEPFMMMQAAIFTKEGSPVFKSLKDASGRKLGITKRSAWIEPLKRDHPNIELVEYATLTEVLKAVSREEVDLTIFDPFVARYQIETLGVDLRQSGNTKYKQPVAIAVTPSKPELVSYFNRLIKDMGQLQIVLILEKWNNLHVIERKGWVTILAWGGVGAFTLIFVVLLISYVNRRKALEHINNIAAKLSNAQRVAQLGSWDVNSEGKITSLSSEAANILGVSMSKSMTRLGYVQMIHKPDRRDYMLNIEESLVTGLLNVEYRVDVDGQVKWVKEVSELEFDSEGKFVSASTIIQDINDFKAQQDTLVAHQSELRELAAKLLSVQEEERRRVARELHDDLSQRLAVLSIDLGMLIPTMPNEESKKIMQNTKQKLVGIAEDTHSLSRRLHPSILDDLGLVEALRSEIDNYQRREPEVRVEFFSTTQSLDIDSDVELVIFRVVQEALRNVSKYSEASLVKVSLISVKDSLILQIEDDGMGFDVVEAKKAPGLGLKSMMERARLINATLDIKSEENRGVVIELHIPSTVAE